uniref:BRCA1-A complex subunit Abraxas 1 n=1 Tax=Oncorhynchus tshawytscha TaxID=74940 RepID=A0A8C8JKI4_ONCTS
MADSNSSVRISGFVLGSLMFHHFNSDSDVLKREANITDSQIDNIQFEHHFTSNNSVFLPAPSVYNSIGEVNQDEVRHLFSNYKEENVIGWYKQQRYTDQQITFREQVIHENLKRAVSNQELMFLLLTPSEVTSSGSTHKLGVCSLQITFSQYRSVPVRVSNLGLLEQQDYWRLSASCSSVNYNHAVWKHRYRFFSLDGSLQEVDEINEMNNSLQGKLKWRSERLVEELLADVSSLRTVSERKQEQKKKQMDSTPAQSQENVLLCETIKTLFPGAALLQTQALTFQGFPVPEFCCNTDHGIDITTTLKGRLGRGGGTSWIKHPLWESSDTPKRRKNMLEETEGSSLSVSGSETEDDLIPDNQNRNNLDMSNRGQKLPVKS